MQDSKNLSKDEIQHLLSEGRINEHEAGALMARRKALEAGATDSDLIQQNWQAPDPRSLRGSSREIWEYPSEKGRPGWDTLAVLLGIILTCLAGFALVFRLLFRQFR